MIISKNKTTKVLKDQVIKIIRVPRPYGTTQLALDIRNPDTTSQTRQIHHKTLVSLLIKEYLLKGYKYNEQIKTIDEISQWLNVPTTHIIRESIRINKAVGILANKDNIQDLKEMVTGLVTRSLLENQAKINGQYEMLNKAQKGKFVPFLTSEVNTSLKLLLESNKGGMDLLKILTPGGPQIQVHAESTTNVQNNILSTESAIAMLDAKNQDDNLIPIGEASGPLSQLAEHYLTDEVPIIDARHQDSQIGEGRVNAKEKYLNKKKAGRHAKGPNTIEAILDGASE